MLYFISYLHNVVITDICKNQKTYQFYTRRLMNPLIDWLIDFNGMLTCLRLWIAFIVFSDL